MKFVNIRELRQNTGKLKATLKKSGKIVLTSNGKPIALVTPVTEESMEDELMALRKAELYMALERVRDKAKARGLDKLSIPEIDRIIQKSRKQRKAAGREHAGSR